MSDQLLLFVGELEDDLGAVNVGFNRMDGRLDDQLDADRSREVHDHVGAVDELGEHRFVGDAVDRVSEFGMRFEMGDVVNRPGREIVEGMDLVAAREERLGEMGAHEAGAAGD